jgi:hypothetical protein
MFAAFYPCGLPDPRRLRNTFNRHNCHFLALAGLFNDLGWLFIKSLKPLFLRFAGCQEGARMSGGGIYTCWLKYCRMQNLIKRIGAQCK